MTIISPKIKLAISESAAMLLFLVWFNANSRRNNPWIMVIISTQRNIIFRNTKKKHLIFDIWSKFYLNLVVSIIKYEINYRSMRDVFVNKGTCFWWRKAGNDVIMQIEYALWVWFQEKRVPENISDILDVFLKKIVNFTDYGDVSKFGVYSITNIRYSKGRAPTWTTYTVKINVSTTQFCKNNWI